MAQSAIKDPQSLDWSTSFQLIKSAVIAVGGFDKIHFNFFVKL